MHCGALIVCSGIDCRMHYEWCENLWSSPTARSADRMRSVACMHAHHAAYSMHAHRRLVCNTHGLHSLSLQQLIFKMDARSVQILMENPLGWWRRILRRMNGRNSHTCSCPKYSDAKWQTIFHTRTIWCMHSTKCFNKIQYATWHKFAAFWSLQLVNALCKAQEFKWICTVCVYYWVKEKRAHSFDEGYVCRMPCSSCSKHGSGFVIC